MESTHPLPPTSHLSPSTLSFLNHHLCTEDELHGASDLASQLQSQCLGLDQRLADLNLKLQASLASYASFSESISGVFCSLSSKLNDLGSSARNLGSSSDERDGGEALGRTEQILGEELPALAKEVARVETVRIYAETTLKLDTLVGEIEDAVSSSMKRNLKKRTSSQNSEDLHLAIKSLKTTEDILTLITKTHPNWERLVSAADHRVDRALAVLRPQAIADHRNLLASLGWPPPLSNLKLSDLETRKSSEVMNPLFSMQGELKHHYCDSFLALCSLQELQMRRKSRQLEGYNCEVVLHQALWVIEELVSPISIACQCHFLKWVDKPEFIFTLVYKITRDYVDSMDELLQPLVDEAKLVGYSCREEWISAMVTSLSTYVAKEVIPIYVRQLDEESVTGIQSQAKLLWLNLVDLMISFDKRIQSLVSHSGVSHSYEESGNLQRISSLSVFCDCPNWLDLWAEIELTDALGRLKPEMEDQRKWSIKIQGTALLSGTDDYKSPAISSILLRLLTSVIDRCRPLPSISLRSKFVRLGVLPLINRFTDNILLRCQEAEGLTALADDEALIKVTESVNAAHYIESVLREWSDDVFYLEMGFDASDESDTSLVENSASKRPLEGPTVCIFDEAIRKLEEFRTVWVDKLSVAVLRGFDARCREYLRNRKQWQESGGDGWAVSKSFLGALDHLQGKCHVLDENMNAVDFVAIWRSLAAGVDRSIFNGIFMSNAKFYEGGVGRLANDMDVLFGVFRTWCLRPEGFFPKSSEGLKLLRMGEKQLKDCFAKGEKWIKENRIARLSVAEVEKIARSRVFTNL